MDLKTLARRSANAMISVVVKVRSDIHYFSISFGFRQ